MRIKICGITQPDQGRSIAQLGATALGFICVRQSSRYVTPEQIRAVVENLPTSPIDRVGVFVDAAIEEIVGTAAIGQLSAVQLHGSESPQFCRKLREALPHTEIIKALRVQSAETLQQTQSYEGAIDALLLDAFDPQASHAGMYGGTGRTLDWLSLKHFRPFCPWLLAGGITPDNVLEAVSQIHPDGIDVSSGVEKSAGDKDLAKVTRLLHQLQSRMLVDS
ncbi:MAG: phosphoribosylanthranilate isomerase [Drouetiella hepatica Uher 2000/2452]|jgi:phosphoribosylanthranilate isomerase|uniref:N-(5'-phosphoribosyl)anthranilate isomerase n=1 Tax=Drouetiella hepatica Uher 2000/2452 TaxID=904376 RepID=A0A951QBU5_9CYAN|nr:phosphoribosylanthranilate isomerase [Drouetiella hepatica Uher 2000/2452]